MPDDWGPGTCRIHVTELNAYTDTRTHSYTASCTISKYTYVLYRVIRFFFLSFYIIYIYIYNIYICFSVVSFINRCAPRRGTPSAPKDLIAILTSPRENRRSVRHRSFWRRTGTRGTLIRSSGWRAGVEVISRIFQRRRAKLRGNNPPGRRRSSHGAGSLPGWISVLEPRDWRVL